MLFTTAWLLLDYCLITAWLLLDYANRAPLHFFSRARMILRHEKEADVRDKKLSVKELLALLIKAIEEQHLNNMFQVRHLRELNSAETNEEIDELEDQIAQAAIDLPLLQERLNAMWNIKNIIFC